MPESAVAAMRAPARGGEAMKREGRFARFFLLLTQLVLIGGVIHLFDIESRRHFLPMYGVIVAGFAIHAWLPRDLGLCFFALLSVVSVPLLLGLVNGLAVLGLGAILIGVCYLPIGLWCRVMLLTAFGAVLIALRTKWPSPVWPVLGSMFMFRLLVYVYSTRHTTQAPLLRTTVSYFFLIPNVCFPLFPVVDYETYCERRFDGDEWDIYQTGVRWVIRGISHLLVYRYIQSALVPEPYELHDISKIVLFMVTNYALYLQVSGHFHLITGLLHLFGFHLPRTHDHFFLASSFVDIWRRINIYWKDFLAKLFFFPMLYAVHGRGASMAAAAVAGVGGVFVATWLLHSWQSFWLLGHFPVTATDAALWAAAGGCVAVNSVLALRRPTPSSGRTWAAAISLSLRTVGMFLLVSLFWACWTDPSFPYLLHGALYRKDAGDGMMLVLMWVLAAVLIGVCLIRFNDWRTGRGWTVPEFSFRQSALLHVIGLSLFLTATSCWVSQLFDAETAGALAEFRSDSAAREAARGRMRGYYEQLNAGGIQAGPLLSSLSPHAESDRRQAAGFEKVSRVAGLELGVELLPGIVVELGGAPTSINHFGMRDHNSITLHKAPGTVRIAMVGSSVVMGYGVADHEVFTRIFEERLNAELPDTHKRYEVLNFGVGKQWASHRLVRIQRVVLGFEPDAIYYFAHQDEFEESASHIAQLLAHGRPLPSERLKTVVTEAGITSDMPLGGIQGRLQPRTPQLLGAIYRSIVDECRRNGILPVWVYLPIPMASASDISSDVMPIARDAGFIVLDLSAELSLRDPRQMLSSPDEMHPHAAGHRLIADALIKAVKAHPDALPR